MRINAYYIPAFIIAVLFLNNVFVVLSKRLIKQPSTETIITLKVLVCLSRNVSI